MMHSSCRQGFNSIIEFKVEDIYNKPSEVEIKALNDLSETNIRAICTSDTQVHVIGSIGSSISVATFGSDADDNSRYVYPIDSFHGESDNLRQEIVAVDCNEQSPLINLLVEVSKVEGNQEIISYIYTINTETSVHPLKRIHSIQEVFNSKDDIKKPLNEGDPVPFSSKPDIIFSVNNKKKNTLTAFTKPLNKVDIKAYEYLTEGPMLFIDALDGCKEEKALVKISVESTKKNAVEPEVVSLNIKYIKFDDKVDIKPVNSKPVEIDVEEGKEMVYDLRKYINFRGPIMQIEYSSEKDDSSVNKFTGVYKQDRLFENLTKNTSNFVISSNGSYLLTTDFN